MVVTLGESHVAERRRHRTHQLFSTIDRLAGRAIRTGGGQQAEAQPSSPKPSTGIDNGTIGLGRAPAVYAGSLVTRGSEPRAHTYSEFTAGRSREGAEPWQKGVEQPGA